MNLTNVLLEANVPLRYVEATLAQDNKLPLARTYVDNFLKMKDKGLGLFIYGHTGAGKTHTACAVLHDVALFHGQSRDVSTYFFNVVNDLPHALDMRHFKKYDRYTSIVRRATSVDLLVVDDLLRIVDYESARSLLYRIYEARYHAMLPTITTTNGTTVDDGSESFDWNLISAAFNDPFVRRLRDTTIGVGLL